MTFSGVEKLRKVRDGPFPKLSDTSTSHLGPGPCAAIRYCGCTGSGVLSLKCHEHLPGAIILPDFPTANQPMTLIMITLCLAMILIH
jgi:hypothetical protein